MGDKLSREPCYRSFVEKHHQVSLITWVLMMFVQELQSWPQVYSLWWQFSFEGETFLFLFCSLLLFWQYFSQTFKGKARGDNEIFFHSSPDCLVTWFTLLPCSSWHYVGIDSGAYVSCLMATGVHWLRRRHRTLGCFWSWCLMAQGLEPGNIGE